MLLSLLLCVAQSHAGKKQQPPGQISSARSVAVVAHAIKTGGGRSLGISDPGLEAQLRDEAENSLRRLPDISVIADPGAADLVFVLLLGDWKTRYGEDLGLIFTGARSDSANSVPLWVGEGQDGFSAADYFLAEVNPSQRSASALSFIVPGRMARLRLRSKGAVAADSRTVRPGIPDELLRAKSASIFGYSPDNPWGVHLSHPFRRGSLAASLEKWGRFKMADNVQDADLIFVTYSDEHRDVDLHARHSQDYTREALIIFANTRTSDVAPTPLWMEQVDEKEVWGASVKLDMAYVLRKDLERAERAKR